MKLTLPQITFRGFLELLLGCFLLAFPFFTVLCGPNYLFNGTTCLIVIYLLLFLIVSLKFSEDFLFSQVSMMAIFFLIFVFPRLLEYLIRPNLVVFPFGEDITSKEINLGLMYIFLGTLCIFIGFSVAEYLWSKIRPKKLIRTEKETLPFSISVMFIVFLIVIIVDWYIQYGLGLSYFFNLRLDKYNALVQFLRLFFNIDMVFFIFFATLVFKLKKGNKVFWLAFLTVNIYIFVISLSGSRITGLRVMLMMVVILLALRNNFTAYLNGFISVIAYLVVISFILYPIATQIRINLSQRDNYLYKGDSLIKKITLPYRYKNTKDGLELYRNIEYFLATTMNKLGLVDFAVLTLSQDADSAAKAKYMNLSYNIKSIINSLVPGDLFSDATVNTSRLVTVLYRGFSEKYVETHGYFSEFYLPWGVFFLIFGWWTGLFMLSVSGFFIHSVYWIVQLFFGRYRYYFAALSLLTFSILFFGNSGIDHWISNSILLFVSAFFSLLDFYFFSFILSKIFFKQK